MILHLHQSLGTVAGCARSSGMHTAQVRCPIALIHDIEEEQYKNHALTPFKSQVYSALGMLLVCMLFLQCPGRCDEPQHPDCERSIYRASLTRRAGMAVLYTAATLYVAGKSGLAAAPLQLQ